MIIVLAVAYLGIPYGRGPKGELRCKNGHEIKSGERRAPKARCLLRLGGLGERRKRILEHLRSNEASFGNIFQ